MSASEPAIETRQWIGREVAAAVEELERRGISVRLERWGLAPNSSGKSMDILPARGGEGPESLEWRVCLERESCLDYDLRICWLSEVDAVEVVFGSNDAGPPGDQERRGLLLQRSAFFEGDGRVELVDRWERAFIATRGVRPGDSSPSQERALPRVSQILVYLAMTDQFNRWGLS